MKRYGITKKIRKIINKSGKAKCLICNKQHPLEEHHIAGRKIPNCNHPSNLCNICPNCHTRIHLGQLILEGWFKTTNGTELLWHKIGQENFSGKNIETYTM